MTLHLLVTKKCHHNCPLCCNKQYDLNEIPVVTEKDVKNADMVCITGGEPLLYPQQLECLLLNIHNIRQEQYPGLSYNNKKPIILYTTGKDLDILQNYPTCRMILNGLSIGPKSYNDWKDLERFIDYAKSRFTDVCKLTKNRLYVFPEWKIVADEFIKDHDWFFGKFDFEIIDRKWQTAFKPAKDSIFKRMPLLY